MQEVIARIIEHEEYPQSLRLAGAAYQRRAEVLTDAIEQELGEEVEIWKPRGGFFLWFGLRDHNLDFAQLYDLAQDHGVSYQRGEWFAASDEQTQRGRMRFSFSRYAEPQLRDAVFRFSAAMRELRA